MTRSAWPAGVERSVDPGLAKPRAADAARPTPAFAFEAVPADIDERAVQQASGLSAPGEIAALLGAREGAFGVDATAGQVMSSAPIRRWRSATRLFSKPAGRAQAAEQLRALAGRSHELHSAVAVARDGKILFDERQYRAA
mgnify:CR=1 FL=1